MLLKKLIFWDKNKQIIQKVKAKINNFKWKVKILFKEQNKSFYKNYKIKMLILYKKINIISKIISILLINLIN